MNRSCKIVLAALLATQSFAVLAQTTNAVSPADYPKFIAQRNIFDPNRIPNVPFTQRSKPTYTPPVVRQVDAFSLVGIIGYGEGQMAGVYVFFDGTKSEYRKTAQLNDTIANFKITDIAADSVTLMSDTNGKTVMKIGEQLHYDGIGHWLGGDGSSASYNDNNNNRYYNERNGNRNGFGNGGNRRRNNNFGNGGNYNNRNFNRGGNNFGRNTTSSDYLQQDNAGQDMNLQDYNNNNTSPDDNIPPDDTTFSSDNAASDIQAQGDTVASQAEELQASSGGSTALILERLRALRAAQLQQQNGR